MFCNYQMCHKNQIVCSTSILKFSWLKCDKSKSSAKYHKILMSRFWKNVFCVPLLFCRHVCLSNLKHAPSLELLLTAHKTVFSHLNWGTRFNWYDNYVFDLQYMVHYCLNSRSGLPRSQNLSLVNRCFSSFVPCFL